MLGEQAYTTLLIIRSVHEWFSESELKGLNCAGFFFVQIASI